MKEPITPGTKVWVKVRVFTDEDGVCYPGTWQEAVVDSWKPLYAVKFSDDPKLFTTTPGDVRMTKPRTP